MPSERETWAHSSTEGGWVSDLSDQFGDRTVSIDQIPWSARWVANGDRIDVDAQIMVQRCQDFASPLMDLMSAVISSPPLALKPNAR